MGVLFVMPYDKRLVDCRLDIEVVNNENKSLYIFIESQISLRYRLPPNNFSGREAHDDIYMGRAPSNLVHVMTQAMSLCEQDFGQVVGLLYGQFFRQS